MDSGAFGKITEAEMHYDVDFPSWISGWNSPDYEPGNGMLFGLGSHTIDQALQLFGKPKSVTAFYRSLRGVESKTDDTFTIILQYGGEQKNLMVTIKTTVVSPMQYPLKWLVRGYKGSYVKVSCTRFFLAPASRQPFPPTSAGNKKKFRAAGAEK